MHFGLCTYEWRDDAYVPPVGTVGAVDLRPVPEQGVPGVQGSGPVVVCSALPIPRESLIRPFDDARSALNYTWRALTAGSDPLGLDGPKPLMPQTDGLLVLRLGGVTRTQRFNLRSAHANRVLTILRNDFADTWERTNGADHCRRVLDMTCETRGHNDWRLFVPRRLRQHVPGRLLHATSYSENFDGSDSDTMGHQLTWTELGGSDWDNRSNRGVMDPASSSFCSCRAEHDLSSSDHYVQVLIVSTTGNYGPAARFSSSAETLYSSEASAGIWRLIKFVAATRTQLTSDEPGPGGTNRVRVAGSTITGYRNGTQYQSTTDTAISSGTRAGMYGRNNSGSDISFDDWLADDEAVAGNPWYYRHQQLLASGA